MTDASTAYVGIGSNLDQPERQVVKAMQHLVQDRALIVDRCSSLYRSAPVGIVDQPDFINAVCRVTTILSADGLLQRLQQLETQAGRKRDGSRWGPRVLDLDLLLFNSLSTKQEHLVLPHPRMHERAFVLYPLMEIAPDIEIPGLGPVSRLIENCREQVCDRLDPDPDRISGEQASSDQPA